MSTRRLRSIVLFVVGIAGIVYEIVIDHAERPTLLILLAAMVGLPAFLKVDEARKNGKNGAATGQGDKP
jgi:hypothetical protein